MRLEYTKSAAPTRIFQPFFGTGGGAVQPRETTSEGVASDSSRRNAMKSEAPSLLRGGAMRVGKSEGVKVESPPTNGAWFLLRSAYQP